MSRNQLKYHFCDNSNPVQNRRFFDLFFNPSIKDSFEWSDGRIETLHGEIGVTIVQKNPETGEYIWYKTGWSSEEQCNRVKEPTLLSFEELIQVYDLFDRKDNFPGPYSRIALLWEIVMTYNDTYRRWNICDNIPANISESFVNAVLDLLSLDKRIVPLNIRAELYREIGMFKKCTAYDENNMPAGEQRELMAEIIYRATLQDNEPFIIEEMKYYNDNKRESKRYFFEALCAKIN